MKISERWVRLTTGRNLSIDFTVMTRSKKEFKLKNNEMQMWCDFFFTRMSEVLLHKKEIRKIFDGG